MKRILVCSPVRGGVSPNYIKSVLALLFWPRNRVLGGPKADYDIDFAWTSGTSVAMARDELAGVCIARRFDGLLFWDIDLGHADGGVFVAMVERLLSHIDKVDIVAGQYCGHNFLSHFHGATIEGAALRDDGLLEMAQIPLGFSWISTKALLQIKEKQPHHQYILKETLMNRAKTGCFEFFPNGVVGPNTAEGKLARIRDLMVLTELPRTDDRMIHEGLFQKGVMGIVADSDYSQNIMLGEDYYFCKLARESGLKLYVDNNLIVSHETNVRLPVKNQDILSALVEEWRLHNDAKPEQVKELVEKLRPLLCQDIP